MLSSSSLEKTAFSIQSEIDRLSPLVEKLKCSSTEEERNRVLDELPEVNQFFIKGKSLLKRLSAEQKTVIKSVAAIGQAKQIFSFDGPKKIFEQKLKELLNLLLPVEKFYREMGGIVGYHWLTLSALAQKDTEKKLEI